jgi:hypothetical protein
MTDSLDTSDDMCPTELPATFVIRLVGRVREIAKTDASRARIPFVSGIYVVVLSGGDKVAKMDVFRAEIRFISRC